MTTRRNTASPVGQIGQPARQAESRPQSRQRYQATALSHCQTEHVAILPRRCEAAASPCRAYPLRRHQHRQWLARTYLRHALLRARTDGKFDQIAQEPAGV